MLQRYRIFLNGCNITTFFNTIQSFFIGIPQKHIKTTFYLNVTEYQTPLEDVNMNCHQKKRDRKLGLIGQGMV